MENTFQHVENDLQQVEKPFQKVEDGLQDMLEIEKTMIYLMFNLVSSDSNWYPFLKVE